MANRSQFWSPLKAKHRPVHDCPRRVFPTHPGMEKFGATVGEDGNHACRMPLKSRKEESVQFFGFTLWDNSLKTEAEGRIPAHRRTFSTHSLGEFGLGESDGQKPWSASHFLGSISDRFHPRQWATCGEELHTHTSNSGSITTQAARLSHPDLERFRVTFFSVSFVCFLSKGDPSLSNITKAWEKLPKYTHRNSAALLPTAS